MIPEICDNDADTVSVLFAGKEIKSWSYDTTAKYRLALKLAHAFVEGWYLHAQAVAA